MKKIIIIIAAVAATAAAAVFLRSDTDVTSSWRTMANGWADISLELYDDNTFEMSWELVEENEKHSFHGTWRQPEKDEIELKFSGEAPQMDVDDVGLRKANDGSFIFTILDASTDRARIETGGMPLYMAQ